MAKQIPSLSQTSSDVYTVDGIHHEIVRNVADKLPDRVRLHNLAEFFKIFGDGTRIAIIWALSESDMCGCDLCAVLNMKQSAVSHQLKTFRQARVVKSRREGKHIFYSLDDEHVRHLLTFGMQHLEE